MPVFPLGSLVDALGEQGFSCRAGVMERDVHPTKRPYFEQWLSNRDGFIKFVSCNVDFVGIEEVMRMGPFYNVYCLVENDFIFETDENAHNLLDTSPYFQLHNGKVVNMGWDGGVLANILTKDEVLSQEFARNIMKEEVKKITVRAANYCCVIETRTWDSAGLASAFKTIDRIAYNVRWLVKTIHLGEYVER
ncbi:MAG TPA: hypothetical protein VNI77_03610 [Nitrososphaera sp.]|nr:hypothetical protein [Nitrososphaera sp.]